MLNFWHLHPQDEQKIYPRMKNSYYFMGLVYFHWDFYHRLWNIILISSILSPILGFVLNTYIVVPQGVNACIHPLGTCG
jgi:hypothetical protein